ncbi:MAG: hypothetical protein M1838_002181 [Thelocarpon superellum]|nr:MAG: hypothetical protein M1838_002181 [Thelocarpon superellum]
MAHEADSDTLSIDTSYLRMVTIRDRQFQQYALDNLIWFAPEEAERLNLQHEVFNLVFDHRLIFPPITTPQKILDCGYGSAAWAIDVAEQFPDSEIVGVDISPQLKPDETPENLWLQVSLPTVDRVGAAKGVLARSCRKPVGQEHCACEIVLELSIEKAIPSARSKAARMLDDLNKRFTFPPNSFDLVHSRLVANGINRDRWPQYLRDIKRALKPGGWVQMVELYYNCQSDNGSLTDDHALRQWSSQYLSSMDGLKDLRAPMRLAQMMRDAGLVDLETRMIPLPLCAWSNVSRTVLVPATGTKE